MTTFLGQNILKLLVQQVQLFRLSRTTHLNFVRSLKITRVPIAKAEPVEQEVSVCFDPEKWSPFCLTRWSRYMSNTEAGRVQVLVFTSKF